MNGLWRQVSCASVVVLFSTGWAQQITLPESLTANGETFEEVVYVSHDDAKLKIHHKNGIANLLLVDLSSELQTTLGFDPARASAALAKENAARAEAIADAEAATKRRANEEERQKLRANAKEMAFDVNQVLGSGRLIATVCKPDRKVYGSAASRVGLDSNVRVIYGWRTGDQDALLTGYTKSAAEGDRIETKAFEAGVEEVDAGGYSRTLRVYEVAE
jgi:hypothetical protein